MTIREYLEAIRDRCVAPSGSDYWNGKDAVAALALLDAAPQHIPRDIHARLVRGEAVRLVPDPVPVASRNAP